MIPNKYPFTNFHALNLDWILEKLAEMEDKLDHEVLEECRRIISTLIIQDIYDEDTETLTIELVLPPTP